MDDKKWVVVTGASGGMGAVLSESFAQRGFHVVMACRNRAKADPIRQELVTRTGNEAVEIRELDLASLESVKQFVAGLAGQRVEVLMNNAGTMNDRFRLSPDGFEEDMAVNYVGTAALIAGLLPLMNPGGRVINTISCTYRIGRLEKDFFQPDSQRFGRFGSYATSKLALLLLTQELGSRLPHQVLSFHAVDPGVVNTGMLTMHRWFDPIADLIFRPLVKTPQQGASTALCAAFSAESAAVCGFWRNRRLRTLPRFVREHSLREWLWQQTVETLKGRGCADLDAAVAQVAAYGAKK